MLWPWDNEGMATVRDGAWFCKASHSAMPEGTASQGMLRKHKFQHPLPLFPLPFHTLNAERGWQHAPRGRGTRAILWSTEGREMHCTSMNRTRSGEAGGGMLEGLSPPDAKHTRHLEHAKFRSKKHRKDGGKGTQ